MIRLLVALCIFGAGVYTGAHLEHVTCRAVAPLAWLRCY